MAEVGSLRASLSANHAQFASDMKRARDAVRTNAKGMSTAMDSVSKKFASATSAINRFGGMAIAGAATAAAVFIKKQIDIADEMGKLAMATGTTSEYLSSMILVASQAGSSLEIVAKASKRLAMNMADFRRGVGESKEAFDMLNISVVNSDGTLRGTEEVINDIADKFAGMEDGADKTAIAMRLFGKAGAELIPMLNMGSAGIKDLQNKAEEMGLVISTKTALEAAYLNDQLDLMQTAAMAAGRGIALSLVPWLNQAASAIKLAKEENGTLMAAWVALGAAGDAVFAKSITQEINETKDLISDLTERLEKYKKAGGAAWYEVGVEKTNEILDAQKQKLAELQAQKEKSEKQDLEMMQRAADRQSAVAEAQRKNTEEMIKQGEEKAKVAAAAKAAATAAEQAAKSRAALIESLEKEENTLGLTNAELKEYEMLLLGGSKAQQALVKTIAERIEKRKADIQAIEDQKKAQKEAAEEAKRLNDALIDQGKAVTESVRTPMEAYTAEVENLDRLLAANVITHQTYTRAVADAWKTMKDASKGEVDEMTEFVKQAASNMQDAMADGLFNFMQGEMTNLGDDFKKMIDRMVANMLASQLNNWLFGSTSETGQAGGILGGMFNLFGGGRASGGPVYPNTMHQVNERGPELLETGGRQFLMMANQGGKVTPLDSDTSRGDNSVVVNINVAGVRDEGGLRKTADQIAQRSGLAAQRAMSRNG